MNKIVPILTGWGLFTGPEFMFMVVPDSKPQTKEQEEQNRIAAARQDAQYADWIRRGAPMLGGFGSSPCHCQCRGKLS
jgi:hypothetical protein